MSFKGDLKKLPLADVFNSVHQNSMSGALAVRDVKGERLIAFETGFVTGCTALDDDDDLAGELVRRRVVDSTAVSKPSRFFRRKSNLKQALKRQRVLDSGEFDSFTRQVVLERIYSCFLLEEGSFEFIEDYDTTRFSDDEQAAEIRISPNEILMEAMRRVDEWKRIRRSIPSFREVYVATREPEEEDDDLVREILGVTAAGNTDLGGVLSAVPAAKFAACEKLLTMVEQGVLRVATAPEYLELGKRAEEGGDLDGAVSFYSRGLHYERGNRELHERRVTLLERLDRKQEAADERKLFAGTLLEQGDDVGAQEQFAKAAKLVVEDPLPMERLLDLQIKAKDYEKARNTGVELVALYLRLGLGEKARDVLPRVLALRPKDRWLRERVAETHVELSENAIAARIYKELADEAVAEEDTAAAIEQARRASELLPDDARLKTYLDELESGAHAESRRRRRVVRTLSVAFGTLAAVLAWGGYEMWALNELRQAQQMCQLERGCEGIVAGVDVLTHLERFRGTMASRWGREFSVNLARLYAREARRAGDLDLKAPPANPRPGREVHEQLRDALDPVGSLPLEEAVVGAEDALTAGDYAEAGALVEDLRARVTGSVAALEGASAMARRTPEVRRLRSLQPRIALVIGRLAFRGIPEVNDFLREETERAKAAYLAEREAGE